MEEENFDRSRLMKKVIIIGAGVSGYNNGGAGEMVYDLGGAGPESLRGVRCEARPARIRRQGRSDRPDRDLGRGRVPDGGRKEDPVGRTALFSGLQHHGSEEGL